MSSELAREAGGLHALAELAEEFCDQRPLTLGNASVNLAISGEHSRDIKALHHHQRNAHKARQHKHSHSSPVQSEPARSPALHSSNAAAVQPVKAGTAKPGKLTASGPPPLFPKLSSLHIKDTGVKEVFPHPVFKAILAYLKQRSTLSKEHLSGEATAQTEPAPQYPSNDSGKAKAVERLPAEHPSKLMFVTWIAFGDKGDAGFKTHNFHAVDMRWAEVVRQSHPGCRIGLVLDQDTQLKDPRSSVDLLHRLTVDKSKFGRNEYNDLYHWEARYSMLQKLTAESSTDHHIVFLDPDVFVIGDLTDVFTWRFDYAATISSGEDQPINGAMHFVHADNYEPAIRLLKAVLKGYRVDPLLGFTSGQRAYSDYFGLSGQKNLIDDVNTDAMTQGAHCRMIRMEQYTLCFFSCLRYNFWEHCSGMPGMGVDPEVADHYYNVDVKVLHFIAYRKLGMEEVYNAYMKGGQKGAQTAFAALPHTEEGFQDKKRFAGLA